MTKWFAVLMLLGSAVAQAQTLCPNGTYVSGNWCVLAPDGSYVGDEDG